MVVETQPGEDVMVLEGGAILPRVDGEGRFACDIYCVGCGYNLRGLNAGLADCPECGESVDLARARYVRFWFDEGWLRENLIGRVCLFVLVAALPMSVVLLVLGLSSGFWRAMEWAMAGLWLMVLAGSGVGAWLLSRPVRWGGRRVRGTGVQAAAMALGVVMMIAAIAWGLPLLNGKDPQNGLDLWGLLGAGLLLAVGAWAAQCAMVWGLAQQCRVLGGEGHAWWLKAGYWPMILWDGGMMLLAVLAIKQWKLEQHDFLLVGVLVCAKVIGLAPVVPLTILTNKALGFLFEAVHLRMGARMDNSGPEGVDLGAPSVGWFQRRIVKWQEKRRAKKVAKVHGKGSK